MPKDPICGMEVDEKRQISTSLKTVKNIISVARTALMNLARGEYG